MKIRKILIANRGEIAVRIINACRELGITSVAVFSSADRQSYHAHRADEAYYIGEAPASESYLKQQAIIDTALKAKCEAIHPGYGFLAENAQFAQKVREAGLLYIGPPPEAIAAMGDKPVARKMMMDASVPVVPGTAEPIPDAEAARSAAEEIGYPILIKAAGGGGGKGMRKIENASELEEGFARAVSEASSSFGNPQVYIEKLLESPRHIEFQILADNHGNVVHLNERECSIQRRHQKVIEEAPSPTLTEEERRNFGKIAVRAARTCGYTNAGTVEFLMDKHRNFYFLEMNTRLQVEHPVTEHVTHIDIVNEQIRIASGEKLRFRQENITWSGHAIECRIYAEDPDNDFYPSIGTVTRLHEPAGSGIRVDSGIEVNSEINVYYDPLIAKLICTAQTREGAIRRTKQALDDYSISGVKTNLAFCYFVLNHKRFQSGNFDTNFISDEFKPEKLNSLKREEKALAAAAAAFYKHHDRAVKTVENNSISPKKWKIIGLQDAMR